MATQKGLIVGAAVALADIFIYEHIVGASAADVATFEPYNQTVEKFEREALIVTTVFTVIVAGIARAAEVFAIGGIAILACDFSLKHANALNPTTNKMQEANTSTSYPMPDYS